MYEANNNKMTLLKKRVCLVLISKIKSLIKHSVKLDSPANDYVAGY